MRTRILLFILFIINFTLLAQQEAQFSHNMFNNMAINPGYAGSNNSICFTALSRQQWLGFKDSESNKVYPQTSLISMDGPVKALHGGLGATILKDKIGFENNIGMKFGYAYRFAFTQGELGIGAQVGFLNKAIDFAKFKPIQTDDPLLSATTEEKTMITDFSFGAFYKIENVLYAGLSASQLSQASSTIGSVDSRLKRHYYLTGGYNYVLPSNPSFELSPSLLVKSDIANTQIDLNLLARYNNKFWAGVSYRTTDALVVLVGLNFKQYHFGYSYDLTTSPMKTGGSNGSHEIMLGYCFNIIVQKSPQSYRNVRFL